MSQGVIVGTNRSQEWLLPWWWMNYRLHNDFPITFFDFGDMSEVAVKWCKERGTVIKLNISEDFVANRDAVDPKMAKLWEGIYQNVWSVRKGWWKKPFAMVKSPYKQTIWMDLDCQVRGSILPIFSYCENEAGLALVPEPEWSQELNLHRGLTLPGELTYNSGVVVYDKESSLIKEWIQQTPKRTHLFLGDQQLLGRIIFTHESKNIDLPHKYNWLMLTSVDPKAIIIHWCGSTKEAMQTLLQSLQDHFLINLSFKDP